MRFLFSFRRPDDDREFGGTVDGVDPREGDVADVAEPLPQHDGQDDAVPK